jgi:N-formylglutamate deformylase
MATQGTSVLGQTKEANSQGMMSSYEPFYVELPRSAEIPVVVEVPHAGLFMDAESLSTLVVPARSMVKDADLYVDELVTTTPDHGATVLVANFSRYFMDLNRHPDDHDRHAVMGSMGKEAPHGIVWHRNTDRDRVLSRPISVEELQRRLNKVYRPYHGKLRDILEQKRKKFGYVVLICAHSMPSSAVSLSGHRIQRADIVPGTRGRTTAGEQFIHTVEQVANEAGYTVRHDEPYKGGFSTMNYGQPGANTHAIQIEVARRLYMNETSLLRIPSGVSQLRLFYGSLMHQLSRVKP